MKNVINKIIKNKLLIYIIIIITILIMFLIVKSVLDNSKNKNQSIIYNGYEIKYNRTYVLSLDNKNYDREVLMLSPYTNNISWGAIISTVEMSKEHDIINEKKYVENKLKNKGMNVSNQQNRIINNKTIVTLDYNDNNQKYILAYMIINNDEMFEIYIKNIDNNYDYDALEDVIKILSTAKLNIK